MQRYIACTEIEIHIGIRENQRTVYIAVNIFIVAQHGKLYAVFEGYARRSFSHHLRALSGSRTRIQEHDAVRVYSYVKTLHVIILHRVDSRLSQPETDVAPARSIGSDLQIGLYPEISEGLRRICIGGIPVGRRSRLFIYAVLHRPRAASRRFPLRIVYFKCGNAVGHNEILFFRDIAVYAVFVCHGAEQIGLCALAAESQRFSVIAHGVYGRKAPVDRIVDLRVGSSCNGGRKTGRKYAARARNLRRLHRQIGIHVSLQAV